MNPYGIIRTLSALVLLVCGCMSLNIPVALLLGEPDVIPSFLFTIIPALLLSLLLLFALRNAPHHLSTRDGFVIVASSWITASLLGAVPFVLSGAIPSYTDAFFETMSGYTTTGASILAEIESLPKTILFWRSFTHWLGGMGIVVLTVAILPLLGIRGQKLVKAEAPWSTVDKVTPKISETAKMLWIIYIFLSAVQTILLMLAGMDLFDALTHMFGTLGTGGFSPRNKSVGAYDSVPIDIIITVFMLVAGANFLLYYRVLTGKPLVLLKNSELRFYLLIFTVATLIIAVVLWNAGTYDLGNSLRYAAFQAASILTTTGYATADFNIWAESARAVIFLLMFIGGSAGSTAGGIKVSRIFILIRQGTNEIRRLIHPHGVFSIRMNQETVKRETIISVMIFYFMYIGILLLTTLLLSFTGADVFTSLSSALATLGNIGPGFNEVGPVGNFGFYPAWAKWYLSLVMMMGRLEIFTVLVAITALTRRRI